MGNEMKQNEISLQSSEGQSLYYVQLHYYICTHCLFMHQARLQVADFTAEGWASKLPECNCDVLEATYPK